MSDSPVSFFSTLSAATDWYTVIVSGTDFQLSAAQIAFDAPNLFTRAFHGDFAEARTRTLALDRHPALFALIADYLRGYAVLPLAPGAVPHTMTPETALANLARDAEYFGLAHLYAQLTAPAALPRHFPAHAQLAPTVGSLDRVLGGTLPAGGAWDAQKGLVDEHGLPILLHATDMVIRLCSAQDVKINGRHPLDVPRNPSTLYCILAHPDPALLPRTPDMYGLPHVDASFVLDDLPSASAPELSALHGAPGPGRDEGERRLPDAARVLSRAREAPDGALWADELWLTVAQRWSWAVDGSERGRLDVKILSARMRSRPFVVGRLNPRWILDAP